MHDKPSFNDLFVRRLHRFDQADICDHLLRLDTQTRRARFLGATSDSVIVNYAEGVLQYDNLICGAFVGGELRGMVELRGLFRAWPPTVEAAFSVEAGWQNIGTGDALFERMIAMAKNRGVRTIRMMCLKDNRRMQHLASKHHAQLSANEDMVEAVLYANWPTPRSIAKEVIGEARGHTQLFFG